LRRPGASGWENDRPARQEGGFTKGSADLEIMVPGTVTARIQEAQKFLLHVLCELVEPGLEKE